MLQQIGKLLGSPTYRVPTTLPPLQIFVCSPFAAYFGFQGDKEFEPKEYWDYYFDPDEMLQRLVDSDDEEPASHVQLIDISEDRAIIITEDSYDASGYESECRDLDGGTPEFDASEWDS